MTIKELNTIYAVLKDAEATGREANDAARKAARKYEADHGCTNEELERDCEVTRKAYNLRYEALLTFERIEWGCAQ